MCLNCNAPVTGNFCANCGQDTKEIRRPFFYLLKDAVRAVFELDGRAWLTLFYLFTRPGFLTREYVSGRRASYTPPLRLFLVISISFFLIVSAFASVQSFRAVISGQDAPATIEAIPPEDEEDTNEADDFENIFVMVENFSFPFLSEARNANLRLYMRSQAETKIDDLRDDPAGFLYGSLDYITVFILLMMPILALIQKILYLRSRRFYVEHLILTLHNHSFLLLALFLSSVINLVAGLEIIGVSVLMELVADGIALWIVVYLFLSLRNFFEQSYLITFTKFAAMAVLYSVVTAFGVFYFAAILFFLF